MTGRPVGDYPPRPTRCRCGHFRVDHRGGHRCRYGACACDEFRKEDPRWAPPSLAELESERLSWRLPPDDEEE